jgi:hypothetical protein
MDDAVDDDGGKLKNVIFSLLLCFFSPEKPPNLALKTGFNDS